MGQVEADTQVKLETFAKLFGEQSDEIRTNAEILGKMQRVIIDDLSSKGEAVSDVTKERLQVLIGAAEEVAPEGVVEAVAAYRLSEQMVAKCRAMYEEADELVGQAESVVEQMVEVVAKGEALITATKEHDQAGAAELLEEDVGQIGEFLASPTVEVLGRLEILGAQSIEKFFDMLETELLDAETRAKIEENKNATQKNNLRKASDSNTNDESNNAVIVDVGEFYEEGSSKLAV